MMSKPIAVVGMACRFAGDVTSPQKLWNLCAAAEDGWSPIPKDRFDVSSLYHADKEKPGRHHATGGYFLREDVALFDAAFFNLPGPVASVMDPQIRLLLESVYEATEDAGIPIEKLSGTNTAVFAGCYGKDYHDLQTRDPEAMRPSFLTGNYTAMLANRISHFYNLQGASMSIDTGCSSGLAALHQGCQTIRSGESDVVIVGASSTMLNPDLFVAMSTLGMIGADGRCYAWDARAQGYGRGEGVAAFVLKSLDAALRDGDQIHTVIREIGLNQDGKTATITSPSVDAQIRLIQDCYRRASLDPAETGYIEAHMTGTQVGDAAEAEALAKVFGSARSSPDDPVWVGSVKTNIGHSEPVSGLAAIIKAAFALKNKQIAPNLNYATPNANIPLDEWHLQVPTSLESWPRNKPLRASVNNFGFGGSNAHVILESAPNLDKLLTNGSLTNGSLANGVITNGIDKNAGGLQVPTIYILSAKDAYATRKIAQNLASHLRKCIESDTKPAAKDLAYTLAERRSRLPWIASVRACNLHELAEHLESSSLIISHAPSKKPRLGFVFNGQGAQWHAMGRELLSMYPVFALAIQEAGDILQDYGADWSLYEELMRDSTSTRVAEIHISQPITVALQLCLVLLLKSWDIRPSAVVSHSSGEIAAAFAAGALTFREALGVVFFRGELARQYQTTAGTTGGMLAAGISPQEASKYTANTVTGEPVVVACVNSPESVTLSGDVRDLDEIATRIDQDGSFARRLKVPLAYHSHHMLDMAPEYTEKLRPILSALPLSWTDGIVFASPVSGGFMDSPKSLEAEHWVRNLTSPVLFSDAFETMCFGPNSTANIDVVIEIGPHGTLAGPIRQTLNGRKMSYLSCLKRSTDAVETMQDLVRGLLGHGYPVSLSAVNSPSEQQQHCRLVSNLPTYPWNHTTRYWDESRVNKAIRNKRFPPHELLGLPMSESTPLKPTWRNFLRLEDLPWLADHKLDETIVFPAAAYISMAIEALRLITDNVARTAGAYKLRDVDFLGALIIPELSPPEGVEIRLSLRPCSENEIDHEGWYQFDICSISNGDTWVENCRGFVSLVAEIDSTFKGSVSAPNSDAFLNVGSRVRDIDAVDLLARVREMGIEYGPSFQNFTDGQAAGERSVSNVVSDGTRVAGAQSYIIHPTILDSIIQTTYFGLPDGIAREAMVFPRSIRGLVIDCQLSKHKSKKLKVLSELKKSEKAGFTSTVSVVDTLLDDRGTATSVLQLDALFCQRVPRSTGNGSNSQDYKPLCSRSRWEPDVLHSIPIATKDAMRIYLNDEEVEFEKKIIRAAYYLIFDAINELEGLDAGKLEWHHNILFRWMKTVVEQGKENALGPGSRLWHRASKGMKKALLDQLSNRGDAASRLTIRVGQKLVAIMRGDVTPLDLMMEDGLLNQYYMELPKLKTRTYSHLSKIVELFAVKNPGAKVLEIGGGTGGATQTVLEAFSARRTVSGSGSVIGRYTFTDVSKGFFEAARQKLATWDSLVEFQKLDIEADPIEQLGDAANAGFELIVASMVLHATKNLHKTLSHVRKLLRPGGKLLLIETTQDRLDMQLIFGTLPGWWLSEEPSRNMSPNVSLERWDDILRATGFTGVEFDIGDCEQAQFQCSSVILTSATTMSTWPSSISILHTSPLPPQSWVEQLQQAVFDKTGISATLESLQDAEPSGKTYILTPEMTQPLLHDIDEATFKSLQQLLVHSNGFLWLSCGGAVDSKVPEFAQTQGLLRALRQEDSDKRCIHLDFEPTLDGPWSKENIEHIVHVLGQTLNEKVDLADVDWEFAVKDSILHVPRVYPDYDESAVPDPKLQPFFQQGQPLSLDTSASTSAEAIFTRKNELAADIAEGHIEIETKAFSLGRSYGKEHASFELSGIVTALGPGTDKSGFKVGDRVCGISRINLESTVYVLSTSLTRIPDTMSFEEGASIPIAFSTAYQSLIQVAKLSKGESVLIHAAADEVGQAALIIAQQTEADVFATCDTEEKRHLLIEEHNLPASRVLYTRDDSFALAIMAQTDGRGVDVVLNPHSGTSLKPTWECIARFGRFVQIGGADVHAYRYLDMSLFQRCVTYTDVDILQLAEYNGRLMSEALEHGVVLHRDFKHRNARIWPVVSIPISKLDTAMRNTEEHQGKVIVIVRDEDLVKVSARPQPLALSNSNATYLIVGGIGGIGKTIVSWMIGKGAGNILIVSRNAKAHPDALSLVELAQEKGCNLQIRNCDVSDEHSFIQLLNDISEILPPIRGVVNAAMILDGRVLESMTYDQWQRAVRTKVNSTINLHKHLPQDLSFFVLLSSLAGIVGHSSQTSYAAGNTFQNALARHRVASGQPAVSIDLSAVSGVGYVASTDEPSGGEVRARIEALGSSSIPVEMVLDILERVIARDLDDPRRPRSVDEAQIIVGLELRSNLEPDAAVRRDRRFGTLRLAELRASASQTDDASTVEIMSPTALLVQAMRTSGQDADVQGKVVGALAARIASIFNINAKDMDLMGVPVSAHGVDSLVAVELRNWLSSTAKAKLSIFEILNSSSVEHFAGLVITRSELISGGKTVRA